MSGPKTAGLPMSRTYLAASRLATRARRSSSSCAKRSLCTSPRCAKMASRSHSRKRGPGWSKPRVSRGASVQIVLEASVDRLYVLQVLFADGRRRRVDVESELWGEAFGPLRDPTLFSQVSVD